jgi:hypothetical protein
MEYLSRKLKQEARTNKNFSYHKNCRKNEINHLCFADDLLIFCSGAEDSIAVVNQCLKEFANLSGLTAYPRVKSTMEIFLMLQS